MAFYFSNSIPPPVPGGTPRAQETARGQRVNQAQYVEERLRKSFPPVAVAGVVTFFHSVRDSADPAGYVYLLYRRGGWLPEHHSLPK